MLLTEQKFVSLGLIAVLLRDTLLVVCKVAALQRENRGRRRTNDLMDETAVGCCLWTYQRKRATITALLDA